MKTQNVSSGSAFQQRSETEAVLEGRVRLLPEQWEALSTDETKHLLYELQVHQVELETQNEELRRAQIELDIARSRYFDLYDLAPVGYCTIDEQGIILEANLTAASMLNATRKGLVDQSITMFIFREDQDIFYFLKKNLIETHDTQYCELRMRRTDGTTLWAHLLATAFREAEGCRVVISDISRRKFREEESELTARLVMQINAPGEFRTCMAGLAADLQGWSGCEAVGIRLREQNDYPYYETKGFPPAFVEAESHLYAQDVNGEILVDHTGSPVLKCMCGNVLQGRIDPSKPFFTSHGSFCCNTTAEPRAIATEADCQGQPRNRCVSERYESVALIPLRAGEQVFGLLQFNDHRTDRFTPDMIGHLEKMADSLAIALSRRQAEEEKAQLQAQLLQAQKMESLGCLAGGVAHDMNNVLGAILALASANLRLQPPDSPVYQAFDTIAKATIRGGKMVKSLLNFARQSPAEMRELDLNQVLEEEIRFLASTTLSKVRLEVDLEPSLRHLYGDANTLTHAFMNLFVNAVDAIQENGILTLKTRNVEKDWIEVMVKDTGTGMSKETLEKAMDPFFTTKELGKGTGLGLSMVYSTVKSHQGHLEIHSELNQGTSVIIRFPACEPTKSALEPAAKLPGTSGSVGLSILLVDDDELIQGTMAELLNLLGHRTTIASSGEEALEKLQNGFNPDIVILDINMPGLGGAKTLSRLRVLYPTLPVLISTGKVDDMVQNILKEHTFVALLSKPFDLDELSECLEQFAEKK